MFHKYILDNHIQNFNKKVSHECKDQVCLNKSILQINSFSCSHIWFPFYSCTWICSFQLFLILHSLEILTLIFVIHPLFCRLKGLLFSFHLHRLPTLQPTANLMENLIELGLLYDTLQLYLLHHPSTWNLWPQQPSSPAKIKTHCKAYQAFTTPNLGLQTC